MNKLMNMSEITLKVKSLYESYPYPSRRISSKKELLKYGFWALNSMQKKKEFLRGKTVLEAGCGTGELSNAIALLGAKKVIGVDLSKNSVKKAKELKKRFCVKNAEFFEMNLLENAFKENKKFDLIISYGVLHHTENPRKAFENIARHLKRNGTISIGLYNTFGRARHRVKRKIVNALAGENFEKRMETAKKLFFKGKTPKQGENWLADKYAHPFEKYYSINEILNWFKEENIEFQGIKPEFCGIKSLTEIEWFLKKKGAFFIITGKKKINFNPNLETIFSF